jgi:hypothetical protein
LQQQQQQQPPPLQQPQQAAAGPVDLQQLAAWMELQLTTLEKVQGVLLAQVGWSPGSAQQP